MSSIDPSATLAPIHFGGLSTGLDTNAIIDALMQIERQPVVRLEARKSSIEELEGLFRQLQGLLEELRDAAKAIDNRSDTLAAPSLDEEFLAFQASSSNDSVLTASASGNAAPGSYSVRVDALASVGRRVSVAYSSATATVGQAGDTLSIDYGGSATIDITVGSGGTTLQALRDAINSDANNDGSVRADLLYDGSQYRLVISGTQTGASHDVTVTTTIQGPAGQAFIDSSVSQSAQDAQLTVLGVPITRESNQVSDALPGVTLVLAGINDPANSSDAVNVDVTRDDDAIAAKLQALVDAFNAVRDFSLGQSTVNPTTNRAGPLSGDSTLRGIEDSLRRVLGASYSFAGNSFSRLSDIGVRFDSNGKLTLDQTVLQDALDKDPNGVRELLSGDGTQDGVATALARAIEPMVRTGDGLIANRLDGFDQQMRSIDDQIARMEARLVQREELLRERFGQLESLVAAFQAQSAFLAGSGG